MHTKEPWFITETPPNHILDTKEAIAIENEKWSVCAVWRDAGEINEPEENARRIVACVNACVGISTDQLERINLFEQNSKAWAAATKATEQRDELLAALKLARAEFDKLPHSLGYTFDHIPAIDEAIKKSDLTQ